MTAIRAARLFPTLLAAGLLAPALVACGDDEVKPGNLVVTWAHGGPTATCGSRGVTNVEARIYRGTVEVASGSASCLAESRTGTIAIANVTPGTYRLVVDAADANGKALYRGEVARQNVAEGKTTETASVTLDPKPGRLIVDWLVPGGKCSSSSIKEVEITLYYDTNTSARTIGSQRVTCEHTFISPDDGTTRAGVLFPDLAPNTDVTVQGFGYDAAKKKIAQATSESFAVGIGDELEPILNLALCPNGTCN